MEELPLSTGIFEESILDALDISLALGVRLSIESPPLCWTHPKGAGPNLGMCCKKPK
jgi:hypothetical protein